MIFLVSLYVSVYTVVVLSCWKIVSVCMYVR